MSYEHDFTGSIPTEPPTHDAEDHDAMDSDSRRLSRVSWGDEEIYEFMRQSLVQTLHRARRVDVLVSCLNHGCWHLVR